MQEPFVDHNFTAKSLGLIDVANAIIDEYEQDGYTLTLRQLYYQFVARDVIPNTKRSYKAVIDLISNARMAGLVDWDMIVDRTRSFEKRGYDHTASGTLWAAVRYFELDPWRSQKLRIEAWIEKDALVGVLERACKSWHVPYFSCRGYVSLSSMYEASQRHLGYMDDGVEDVLILHLGDHDPSGIDMTRDIQKRLRIFGSDAEVRRIALTMEQIEELNPPPNFAKMSDSRAEDYVARYGMSSWELDALKPQYITDLIEKAVVDEINTDVWTDALEESEDTKDRLREFVDTFE